MRIDQRGASTELGRDVRGFSNPLRDDDRNGEKQRKKCLLCCVKKKSRVQLDLKTLELRESMQAVEVDMRSESGKEI